MTERVSEHCQKNDQNLSTGCHNLNWNMSKNVWCFGILLIDIFKKPTKFLHSTLTISKTLEMNITMTESIRWLKVTIYKVNILIYKEMCLRWFEDPSFRRYCSANIAKIKGFCNLDTRSRVKSSITNGPIAFKLHVPLLPI
jgi:hypothetical protein